MTLRDFAQASGVQYTKVYNAMVESGDLKHRGKSADYDMNTIRNAMIDYLARRIEKHRREVFHLQTDMTRVTNMEEEGTE